MNIGEQIGYWQAKAARRRQAEEKASKLIRRARAARGIPGLDKIADEVRAEKLWPQVGYVIGECNARLRGRDYRVVYKRRRDNYHVVVSDNRVVAPRNMPALNAKALAENGFVYAGKEDR